ncbi:MAG: Nif3-like dinuclear metal center hexameric protein [Gemmatimonadaceae bacterium]|nr:Nif3-like dinuclear metal center hexameric protein [Gemmatimonadaceae bacterium]
MTVALAAVAKYLDTLLRTDEIPDYPGAVNGIQMEHHGPVHRVAVAVDASLHAIEAAVAEGANLLVVHHGMFWSGVQPLRGRFYRRVRALVDGDLAVYSAHLPLDCHPTLGNNALLARALDLEPIAPFARFATIHVGVSGETDCSTSALFERLQRLVTADGGHAIAAGLSPSRRTRRWGICTGAGASSETLREAADKGIDTLIVGEGPHHTAVEGPEMGVAVLYGGHYATETFGVRAVGAELAREFSLPWSFVAAPTGL